MKGDKRTRQGLVVGLAFMLVLLGVLVVVLDWREVSKVIGAADWRLVLPALLFTAVSYTCLSFGFVTVCRIFGISIEGAALFRIGLVSNALNNVLSTGGVAGTSLRLLLLGRRGLAVSDIMAASLFHFYFNTLVMLFLLPVGLLYLLLKHSLPIAAMAGMAFATLLFVALLALATALVIRPALRRRFLAWAGRIWQRLTRRDIASSLSALDATMTRGMQVIHERPGWLFKLFALIASDWTSSIVALWFCFDALGDPLKPGLLVTGFAIGVTAGVLSSVPGGMGVQEGSMASIYSLLGVPVEQAALAAILFRVIYYFVPFSASLSLYWQLLRESKRTTPKGDLEV